MKLLESKKCCNVQLASVRDVHARHCKVQHCKAQRGMVRHCK